MIQVEVKYQDDEDICTMWMRSCPQVGEFLWINGASREEILAKHKTASFQVIEVAHWCGPGLPSGTTVGDPVHSVCLYVTPSVTKAEAGL